MTIPAHKVVGDKGKPGQQRGGFFNREPVLTDQSLADYLTRKKRYEALDTLTEAPKKLTFEEWWEDAQHWVPFEEHPEKAIWKAAQENAPSYRPGAEEKT
jgi:hypothetical protein